MANDENLTKGKPFQFRSGEEAVRNGQKGGQKSGAVRRRKRTMKQCAKALMEMPVTEEVAEQLKAWGIEDEDATYPMAIMAAMVRETLEGNVKAGQFVREMIGEDPKTELQKKELKLKTDEFKYRKEQNAKDNGQNGGGGTSLADAIINAYRNRKERDGGV